MRVGSAWVLRGFLKGFGRMVNIHMWIFSFAASGVYEYRSYLTSLTVLLTCQPILKTQGRTGYDMSWHNAGWLEWESLSWTVFLFFCRPMFVFQNA